MSNELKNTVAVAFSIAAMAGAAHAKPAADPENDGLAGKIAAVSHHAHKQDEGTAHYSGEKLDDIGRGVVAREDHQMGVVKSATTRPTATAAHRALHKTQHQADSVRLDRNSATNMDAQIAKAEGPAHKARPPKVTVPARPDVAACERANPGYKGLCHTP